MKIKIYHFYTRNNLASPYKIYGNVPFVLENATVTIFLNGQEIKHKGWTYEEYTNELVIYEYMNADEYDKACRKERGEE